MKPAELRILVVDDVNVFRVQLCKILKSCGLQTITSVENKADAQVALQTSAFHLVISDWHMPGGSGLELLQFVRSKPEFSQLAFMMLTGESQKASVALAVEKGVDAYLLKPVHVRDLLDKVPEALKRRDVHLRYPLLTSTVNDDNKPSEAQLKNFKNELSGFVSAGGQALTLIRSDVLTNRPLFTVFTDRMVAIRGAAQQLGLVDIVQISKQCEELGRLAVKTESRPRLRRAVDSLWDAMTTMTFLLEKPGEENQLENQILLTRLEKVIGCLAGPSADRVNSKQIDQLFAQAGKKYRREPL